MESTTTKTSSSHEIDTIVEDSRTQMYYRDLTDGEIGVGTNELHSHVFIDSMGKLSCTILDREQVIALRNQLTNWLTGTI